MTVRSVKFRVPHPKPSMAREDLTNEFRGADAVHVVEAGGWLVFDGPYRKLRVHVTEVVEVVEDPTPPEPKGKK